MLVLGVDPGMGGSLCALYSAEGRDPELVADIIDMPIMGEGKAREVDGLAVQRWLRRFNASVAYVENVQPMRWRKRGKDAAEGESTPTMGSHAFKLGMAAGSVRTALRLCNIEVRLVTPQSWKNAFELIKRDKEAARQMALVLFPDAAPLLRRKKDEGRAEAALIAAFGARRDYPG